MTVRALREHLERVSTDACSFSISKVQRDRVAIRADYAAQAAKKHALLLLPAYPTGWPEDAPCNNLNVVLDPIAIECADCAERAIFAPLLGPDILAHYEKTHSHSEAPVSRCC